MPTINKSPVLIVGAGPTGLTAANLLGRYGIPTVLVEAKPDVNRRPRSTFVDDEFFRVLGNLGLADDVRRQSLGPATYEHYSALGFLLSREEGQITAHNYPTRSAIFQPWFDQTLLDGVRRFKHVEILLRHELIAIEDRGDAVSVTLRNADNVELTRIFSYVLAADGARSSIRKSLGIEFEAVTPLEARSLRVDTEGDPDRTVVMRSRPTFRRHASSFPAPNGRRYSISVLPGEDPDTLLSDASLQELLKPFHDFSKMRVINKAVYTFRTCVAQRFRKGRVFLLGDAAHVQPPAGSQGMNGGARDANNLAWKIAAVQRGSADPSILDTYEEERYEAARKLVRESGTSTQRSRLRRSVAGVIVRDILFKAASILRPKPLVTALADAAHVRTGQATALKSGVLIGKPTDAPADLLGRVLPNPWIEQEGRAQLLDSLLGHEFAIVGLEPAAALPVGLSHPLWSLLGTRVIVLSRDAAAASPALPDGLDAIAARLVDDRMDAAWRAYEGRWLVLRPDRIVAAVADSEQLQHVATLLMQRLGASAHSNTAVAA